MEIGNEISQKIRSAIKAKLVELGAYVDEELPDYIMVMVANKKSIAQMTEDLGLFLGSNTDKFTTWLHGLLVKLQSITSDPIPLPARSEKVDKSKPKDQSSVTSSGSNLDSKGKGQKSSEDSAGKSKRRSTDDSVDSKKENKKRKLSSEKITQTVGEVSETDSAHVPATVISVAESAQVVTKPPEETVQNHEDAIVSKKTDSAPDMLELEVTKSLKTESGKESVAKSEVKTVSAENETVKAAVTSAEPMAASGAKPAPTKEPAGRVQIVEEDDLSELLLTENDELTEELELEPAVVPATKKSEAKAGTGATAKTRSASPTVLITLPNLSSATSSSGSRPKAVTSPIRQTAHRTASVRPVESRTTELYTRRRRGPVSVIGSVSRDEEEDEYDPYNPAVGNVASVVKVTARKSSVPPKLQANKSLLLKAMNEAEKSIESQRRVAITPVKPFMRSERKDRDRDLRERERERPSRTSQAASKDGAPGSRLARSSLKQVISQRSPVRRSDSPPVYIPTRKVEPAPRGDITQRLGIVSKSRREEAQQRLGRDDEGGTINFVVRRGRDDDKIRLDPEDSVISKQEAVDDELDLTESNPVPVKQTAFLKDIGAKQARDRQGDTEIDSRVVEYEPEAVPSSTEENRSVGSGSQGIPEILDVGPDEFVLDPDLEASDTLGLYEEDRRLVDMKEKQKDKTRFVVTLDGVDEEAYEMGVGEELMEVQGEEEAMEEGAVMGLAVKESGSGILHRSPPKVQSFSISLKDSDEEAEPMQEEATPLQKAKMLERCKFWPACVNGAACEYHHPTVQCKTFPQCKFGDKCLYIHPNCRFDSRCLRPDCPFTHSGKRSIPPASYPMYRPPAPPPPMPTAPVRMKSPPQCRFFPACSNIACPFFHPKPCRFGINCKSRDSGCPFFHPSLPTKDKLKWQAGKTPATTVAAALAPKPAV